MSLTQLATLAVHDGRSVKIIMMRPTLLFALLLCMTSIMPTNAETYTPTSKIGEFMSSFERAYRAGDTEWIQTAVDRDGIIEEAKAVYFSFLGPKQGGESISGLAVVAAPRDYKLSNSLLNIEIESTIPVDFIINFQRTLGAWETTVKVPAGYRDGKIWLAGIKKK